MPLAPALTVTAITTSRPLAGAQEHGRLTSLSAAAPDGALRPRSRLRLAAHVRELDNCTYCPKLCRFACPVAVADGSETLTPRQLALTVALDRRGARALGDDEALRLWSCVDCRGCRSFCDHDNDVATMLASARAELFAAGRAPDTVVAALTALAASGRHPAAPPAWSPPRGDGATAPTWLFLGCQNGSEDAGVAAGALALAQAHVGAVHVPVLERPCCGQPLWRWGDRAAFAAHARAFAAQLAGVRRLVVDDPGCAYTLRTLYPAVGVAVPEVVTTTSLLGRDEVPVPEGAVPHDDEWSTRWLGEPPLRRRLAGPFAVGSVVEGEAGSCGGHLLALFDATLAERVARDCVRDLLGGGGSLIVTASPTCRRRLRGAGAAVVDVLELWSHGRARSG
jgi:Fe-S oxidoreductase